jgi:hypothetical protein
VYAVASVELALLDHTEVPLLVGAGLPSRLFPFPPHQLAPRRCTWPPSRCVHPFPCATWICQLDPRPVLSPLVRLCKGRLTLLRLEALSRRVRLCALVSARILCGVGGAAGVPGGVPGSDATCASGLPSPALQVRVGEAAHCCPYVAPGCVLWREREALDASLASPCFMQAVQSRDTQEADTLVKAARQLGCMTGDCGGRDPEGVSDVRAREQQGSNGLSVSARSALRLVGAIEQVHVAWLRRPMGRWRDLIDCWVRGGGSPLGSTVEWAIPPVRRPDSVCVCVCRWWCPEYPQVQQYASDVTQTLQDHLDAVAVDTNPLEAAARLLANVHSCTELLVAEGVRSPDHGASAPTVGAAHRRRKVAVVRVSLLLLCAGFCGRSSL